MRCSESAPLVTEVGSCTSAPLGGVVSVAVPGYGDGVVKLSVAVKMSVDVFPGTDGV